MYPCILLSWSPSYTYRLHSHIFHLCSSSPVSLHMQVSCMPCMQFPWPPRVSCTPMPFGCLRASTEVRAHVVRLVVPHPPYGTAVLKRHSKWSSCFMSEQLVPCGSGCPAVLDVASCPTPARAKDHFSRPAAIFSACIVLPQLPCFCRVCPPPPVFMAPPRSIGGTFRPREGHHSSATTVRCAIFFSFQYGAVSTLGRLVVAGGPAAVSCFSCQRVLMHLVKASPMRTCITAAKVGLLVQQYHFLVNTSIFCL
mmetsp:Transcript_40726/g.68195  ORF Transcript_40726/g.68195 Transcript_40726/m.68195 type:complete len:253 (-) Transcript_40726:91-849(-)